MSKKCQEFVLCKNLAIIKSTCGWLMLVEEGEYHFGVWEKDTMDRKPCSPLMLAPLWVAWNNRLGHVKLRGQGSLL